MSRAKAIGTEWESRIVKYLREVRPWLIHARRMPALGQYDEGDVHAWPFCIQAKAVQKFDLAGWTADAREQADRAGLQWSSVWIKKRGRPIGEGYAVRTIEEERALMARLRELEEQSPEHVL